MFGSILLWIAVFVMAIGVFTLIWPLVAMRAAIIVPALVVIAIVLAWPVRESRVIKPVTHLDSSMPVWQFDERHATHIAAPPDKVFAAIRAVTPDDIRFFRTLTAIRRGGWQSPPNILNAPKSEPILDLATRTSFRYLADDPPRELVVGTTVAPGVDATMNFLVASDGHGGSNVSTETRVFANSARVQRRFAIYWRIIRPGSDIIRRMWLRAIKLRAERA